MSRLDHVIVLNEDKKAKFEQIYQEYYRQILAFLMLRVREHEIAEDLSHEAFLKFAAYFGKNEVKNSRALLYTIARGILIDHYRIKQKTVAIEEVDELAFSANTHENLVEFIDQKATIETIEGAISALSEHDQELIHLRYRSQLSYAEIAEVLVKSEGAIRVMLHRAHQRIKDELNRGLST